MGVVDIGKAGCWRRTERERGRLSFLEYILRLDFCRCVSRSLTHSILPTYLSRQRAPGVAALSALLRLNLFSRDWYIPPLALLTSPSA